MLGRLLGQALWAPAAIVLASLALHQVLEKEHVWWAMHVAGGAALSYGYLRATRGAGRLLGELRPGGRYLLAFTAACSTALAWEIAEFMSDQLLGTALQEGNLDTMSDLMLGLAGAAAYLAWHALIASAASGGR